ncbi:hypothetical protein [Nocardia cyriacigeorgica]|uniref:hypothetical protein n=3 Tax=Nocardia cyriacigeorgica TaxID=135487 RepID=UPI001109BD84|nr:hypothetical protein [Nocardia cyriacigeorgica]TLF52475.1 hypothetical protein FEK31_27755 [Nocardia cyriacigeorgica]
MRVAALGHRMMVALLGRRRRRLELLALRRETAPGELTLARVELLARRLRELAGAALLLELARAGLLLELPAAVRRELALIRLVELSGRRRLESALIRLLGVGTGARLRELTLP